LVLELSVGLSFDQRQAQWRIDLFWQQLQALSALSACLKIKYANMISITNIDITKGNR